MQLSTVQAVTIEEAFQDFYRLMMTSKHFHIILGSQYKLKLIFLRQANNFYQILFMCDKDSKTTISSCV